MFDRVVVVYKNTPLQMLLKRHTTLGQAEYYLESRGDSLDEYLEEDSVYTKSLEELQKTIPPGVQKTLVERDNIPHFLFRESDLVVIVGPDGLFVNTSKYLGYQPVLTVNPDPKRIDGVLMRFNTSEAINSLESLLSGGDPDVVDITLAKATTNDGRSLLAVNDFLVGRKDQVSARYRISINGREERQSSSGVLVSTGVGSTGWMKSVVTMVQAISGQAPHLVLPEWFDDFLVFAVREPFPSKYTGTSIVFGDIQRGDELVITSEMPEGGTIISDGMIDRGIEFNSGTSVTISISEKTVKLIN